MADPIYISQITLPSGASTVTYDIKDAGARELISALQNYTDYLGVTTTELTDGASTNPITIEGQPVTAVKGNIANYGSKEFIWNGSAWQEFGDLSGLGALAFKASASGSYTPAGTISAEFTGSEVTADIDVVTAGTVTIATSTGTANYTPAGSVSGTAVELSTSSINAVTSVGELPSATMPTFTVTGEVLTITDGAFSAGSLPSVASVSVATGVSSVTDGTFTGTGVELVAEFSGASASGTATFTPSGTISASFSGTAATITVS